VGTHQARRAWTGGILEGTAWRPRRRGFIWTGFTVSRRPVSGLILIAALPVLAFAHVVILQQLSEAIKRKWRYLSL